MKKILLIGLTAGVIATVAFAVQREPLTVSSLEIERRLADVDEEFHQLKKRAKTGNAQDVETRLTDVERAVLRLKEDVRYLRSDIRHLSARVSILESRIRSQEKVSQ